MCSRDRTGKPAVFKFSGMLLTGLEFVLGSLEIVFYISLAVGALAWLKHLS